MRQGVAEPEFRTQGRGGGPLVMKKKFDTPELWCHGGQNNSPGGFNVYETQRETVDEQLKGVDSHGPGRPVVMQAGELHM